VTSVHVFEATSVLETTDAPGVLIGVAKRPVSAMDSERSWRKQKPTLVTLASIQLPT